MKNKIVNLVILIGIIVGGLSYWFIPYGEMNLLGVHIYILMASGAFLGSLILNLLLNEKPWNIALLITAGVLVAVVCRIAFDIIKDSSTHNLFPFEIIAVLFITVPSAFIGSYLSQLIKYIKKI